MANLEYIKKSYLQTKVSNRRKMTFSIGIPILIAVALVGGVSTAPFVMFGLVFITVIAFAGGASDAGTKGEEIALAILSQLPDYYYIFNDLKVPNSNSGKGFTAIDYVVVGKSGIYVVEVKNINGRIVGGENDSNWTVHKVGRKGGAYSSSIRNPIKQVKGQVYALKQHLNAKGNNCWIQGVLLLTGQSGTNFSNTQFSVPCFSDGVIRSYICSQAPHDSEQLLEQSKCEIAWLAVGNA